MTRVWYSISIIPTRVLSTFLLLGAGHLRQRPGGVLIPRSLSQFENPARLISSSRRTQDRFSPGDEQNSASAIVFACASVDGSEPNWPKWCSNWSTPPRKAKTSCRNSSKASNSKMESRSLTCRLTTPPDRPRHPIPA
jgi:hypothetical protein